MIPQTTPPPLFGNTISHGSAFAPDDADVPVFVEGQVNFVTKIQGDPSACDEPPVDFKTKVPFWPDLA